MESKYSEEIQLEEIEKFARFENPNNFDNYFVEIITKLSKLFFILININNKKFFYILDGMNIKYVTTEPLKIESTEYIQYYAEKEDENYNLYDDQY